MVRGGASTVTPITQRSPGSGGPGREMRACLRAERLHGSVSLCLRLLHLPAVFLGASGFTALGLGFLASQMGVIIVPISGLWRGLNELIM